MIKSWTWINLHLQRSLDSYVFVMVYDDGRYIFVSRFRPKVYTLNFNMRTIELRSAPWWAGLKVGWG